jgi:hypothetical protein
VQAHEGTEMGKLIKDFVEYAAKLDIMRRFVMINVMAVIKISKKHDKHSRTPIQVPEPSHPLKIPEPRILNPALLHAHARQTLCPKSF